MHWAVSGEERASVVRAFERPAAAISEKLRVFQERVAASRARRRLVRQLEGVFGER